MNPAHKIPDLLPTIENYLSLARSVGWNARARDVRELLENAVYTSVRWHGGMLTGFGRATSGDTACYYLQDIVVHPAYQKRGFGSGITRSLLEQIEAGNKDWREIRLRCEPHLNTFYAKSGFVSAEEGYLIRRPSAC